MRILLIAILATGTVHAQTPPCDLSGLWVGETRMDRSKVAPTPSKFELKVSDGRVTGTKLAQIVVDREFPATPITGEIQADGSARLEVAASKPDGSPSIFILEPSKDCSQLDGKWAVKLGGRNYGGTATYARQSSPKLSP